MPEQPSRETLAESIYVDIFSVSAVMAGVCLTVIGLFRALKELKGVSTLGDDLLAIDALAFIVSCISSYLALKAKRERSKYIASKAADAVFLLALCLMGVICGLITYELV